MNKVFDRIMVLCLLVMAGALSVEAFSHFGENSSLNAARIAMIVAGGLFISHGMANVLKQREQGLVKLNSKHASVALGMAFVTIASSI
ncbi:MAG: hypothetical protein ACTS9Y_01255 [Methylophilus sp.]|uniref:hypothetical protein n=1 Tax=Methylophilus sp. TaxID=29541 RepID=UPI003F9F845F